MNVQEFDSKHRHGQWPCFVPGCNLPIGDVLLAQKFGLEVCEEATLSLARRSSQRLTPCRCRLTVGRYRLLGPMVAVCTRRHKMPKMPTAHRTVAEAGSGQPILSYPTRRQADRAVSN
jgi:hypothetical protein